MSEASFFVRHKHSNAGGWDLIANKTPLISVVIPYYNASQTIGTTLVSILRDASSVYGLAASGAWLQIVCVDNASTDSSEGKLKEAWELFPCKSFVTLRSLSEPQKGVSFARNRGLERSEGEYIAFIDADDRVHPGYFSLLLEGVASGVDVVSLAFSTRPGSQFAFKEFVIQTVDEFVDNFLDGWWCCSFVARRNLFRGLRFYGQCYEDVGMFPVVLSRSARVLVASKVLYDYTKSSTSLTAQSAAWRSKWWDKQAARLHAQHQLLLPAIRQCYDRDFLKQRMLLRAAAGIIPVLGIRQSYEYVLMNGFNEHCLSRIGLLVQKNLIAAFRIVKRNFLLCLP